MVFKCYVMTCSCDRVCSLEGYSSASNPKIYLETLIGGQMCRTISNTNVRPGIRVLRIIPPPPPMAAPPPPPYLVSTNHLQNNFLVSCFWWTDDEDVCQVDIILSGRSGASALTRTAPTSWWIAPREWSTSTTSGTLVAGFQLATKEVILCRVPDLRVPLLILHSEHIFLFYSARNWH